MIIYVIVFSLATGILAVSTFLSGNGRPDRTAFVTSGLLVACLLGLREGVGTDFYSIYVAGFNSIDEGNESRFEPGFVLLVRALSLFSSNYNFLFFGIALITVGLVYRAIWRISLNPTLAVFIYLVGGIFFFSTNAVRQGLAIAILLNAVPLIQKVKPVRFLLLVLLASTFHVSALVFLPVFLVRFIRVSGRSLIVSLIGIVGIYGVISLFLLEQAASFSDQFARYVGDELYGRSGNFDISNFMYCSVPIVGYYILRDQTEAMDKSDMTRILAMLLYVGIIVTILSGGVFIFSRFAYYFTSFAILLVPNLLSETQKASRRDMFAASYVVILSVSCAYFYGYLNFNMVDPYRWCF